MAEGQEPKNLMFQLRHNRRLVYNVLILNIASVCFGYDISVLSVILAMPAFIQQFGTVDAQDRPFLDARQTSIIAATRGCGTIPAVFVSCYLGPRWGRKQTCMLGCAICLFGTAMQTGSDAIPMITAGMTIANFGYSVMVSMSSALAIELAPVPVRGVIGSLAVVAIGLASMLSAGVGWGTHAYESSLAYRVPIALQNLWPLVLVMLLIFITDSPTSYLINGDDAGAERSLRLVRSGYTDEEIATELETLKLQTKIRKADAHVSWTNIFTGSDLRRSCLATFIGVFQQLSGYIFAAAYATIFLSQIGSSNPFVLVFGLKVLGFAGSIGGLFLIHAMRRRVLLLSSFAILLAIDTTIGGLGFADLSNVSVVKGISALCLLFGFFISMTMAPFAWVNATELPTARLRTVTTAFVLLCSSMTNLVLMYVLPYIADADAGNLGAKTYLIFAGFMLLGLILTFFFFPDAKGRNVAELDRMFAERVPARQFRSWKSTVVLQVGNIMELRDNDKQVSGLVVQTKH